MSAPSGKFVFVVFLNYFNLPTIKLYVIKEKLLMEISD